MKVKAVKVNRAHYFLTDPRINKFSLNHMAVVLFMNFTAYSPYSQNNIKILKTGSQAIPTVNNSPRKTLLRTSKPKQEKNYN